MLKHILLPVAFLLLSPTLVLGQFGMGPPEEDKWEFSILFGLSSVGDTSSAAPVAGQEMRRLVTMNFDSGYIVGARVTENLGQHFGAELEYSLANQPVDFTNLSTAVPQLDLYHRIHSVSYSVLFYPLERQEEIRPYLSVGGGAAFFQVDGSSENMALAEGVDLTNRWKLAGRIGGGVKYRLNEKIGIRFDVIDQITGVPDYGLPDTHAFFQGTVGEAFEASGTLQHMQYSLGIFFYWDGL